MKMKNGEKVHLRIGQEVIYEGNCACIAGFHKQIPSDEISNECEFTSTVILELGKVGIPTSKGWPSKGWPHTPVTAKFIHPKYIPNKSGLYWATSASTIDYTIHDDDEEAVLKAIDSIDVSGTITNSKEKPNEEVEEVYLFPNISEYIKS